MEEIHAEADVHASIKEFWKNVMDGENKVNEKYKEEVELQESLDSWKGKQSFVLEDCRMKEYAALDGHGSNEHEKEGEDIQKKEHIKYDGDIETEGSPNIEEVMDESGGKETPTFESDDETNTEVPLSDAEVEELVAEFLEVESKAAEAQESLEKESLAQVENEVRRELAQNLHGSALEMAVSTEMKTFIEEREAVLDDLETQSSLLLNRWKYGWF